MEDYSELIEIKIRETILDFQKKLEGTYAVYDLIYGEEIEYRISASKVYFQNKGYDNFEEFITAGGDLEFLLFLIERNGEEIIKRSKENCKTLKTHYDYICKRCDDLNQRWN